MPTKEPEKYEIVSAITLEFPANGKMCLLQVNGVTYSQFMAKGILHIKQMIGTKAAVKKFSQSLGNAVNNVEIVVITSERGERILFQGPIWIEKPGIDSPNTVSGVTMNDVTLYFFKEVVTLLPRKS